MTGTLNIILSVGKPAKGFTRRVIISLCVLCTLPPCWDGGSFSREGKFPHLSSCCVTAQVTGWRGSCVTLVSFVFFMASLTAVVAERLYLKENKLVPPHSNLPVLTQYSALIELIPRTLPECCIVWELCSSIKPLSWLYCWPIVSSWCLSRGKQSFVQIFLPLNYFHIFCEHPYTVIHHF